MNLVWKLLRQHISIPQFAGFAFANLFGMLIVLFGFQFYKDVLPVFTQEDSFMKADYLIMSKKIGMGNTISGRSNTFSGSEIDEIGDQKFVKKIGKFTSTEYKVDAQMGVNGVNVLNSELFFESVPDGFVDVPLKDWKYTPGTQEVPIILPRTYINMYNFGFAQSHSLPKISDGLMGMIDFNIQIQAGGSKYQLAGRHQTYSIPECKKGAPLRGRLYKRVVFASLKGAMGEKNVFPKAGGFRRLTAPGFKPPPGLWALGVSGSARRAGWFREGVIYAACWRQPRSGYKAHRPQGDTTTL